jgi:hypothetical protein
MPNPKDSSDHLLEKLDELGTAVKKLEHCLQRKYFQEKQIAYFNQQFSQRMRESKEKIALNLASIKKELKIEFLDSHRSL